MVNVQLGCGCLLVGGDARESIQLMLQAVQLGDNIAFTCTLGRIALETSIATNIFERSFAIWESHVTSGAVVKGI